MLDDVRIARLDAGEDASRVVQLDRVVAAVIKCRVALLVACWLSQAAHADRIVVMEGGRVIQPHPEDPFSLSPGPGHIGYDSYIEGPMVIARIEARGHRVSHTASSRDCKEKQESIYGD